MTLPVEVFDQCLQNNPRGQEVLYRVYAPQMFGVCLRYAGNQMEADDIMQEGFIKVFRHLNQLNNPQALDGWIHRIMVNTAINYYSRQLKFQNEVSLKFEIEDATITADALSKLSYKEMLRVLQGLPAGYRTVFNLYVIDGYTHKEIADFLGISENTSKSQLLRAKASMRKILLRIL
jgi:RNA polymerase sigma-70 factor (ECF subfamily)